MTRAISTTRADLFITNRDMANAAGTPRMIDRPVATTAISPELKMYWPKLP